MVRFPKYIPECFSGIAQRQPAAPKATPKASSPKTGRSPSRSCLAGLALTLSLVAGGCASAPENVVVEPAPESAPTELPKQTKPPVAEAPEKAPVTAQPDVQADGKQPGAADQMVTVSVYTIDDQCNDFVEQSIQVPSDQAITEAVGQAMNAVDYNAFKLDGYQVSINGTTATVDMQLAPSSQRKFVSLSSCEQRALFGSIEETLLKNPDWDVTAVKFTNKGQELYL